jgi:hypothetical protein
MRGPAVCDRAGRLVRPLDDIFKSETRSAQVGDPGVYPQHVVEDDGYSVADVRLDGRRVDPVFLP